MNWKTSLDKYLTTEPDNGFDEWCYVITENHFTDPFYNRNEDWINEYSGVCNKWFNKLFNRCKMPNEAAEIIERAFRLYFKH